jgi:hypothetical protein
VYFTCPGDSSSKIYNYGFCLGKDGVTEEWLNSKAKTAKKFGTVFYRGKSDGDLDLSGLPVKSAENIKIALDKHVLIVSLGAKLNLNYSYLTTIKQKRPNFCRCNKFVSLHIGKPSF